MADNKRDREKNKKSNKKRRPSNSTKRTTYSNERTKKSTRPNNNSTKKKKSITKKNETALIKKAEQNGKKTTKKNGKLKFKYKHPKISLMIKLMIVLILLLTVVVAGVVVGYIFGFFGYDFTIDEKELKIAASNSVIVNSEGTVLADLSGDEKRKIVSLEEMADYLPKAYVAIEDERFYQHHGVDLKRTGGAILTYIFKRNDSSYGGSTITQQLVKNITKESDKSILRKVKEWSKAYQVEEMLSKDEILELYLNILFVGGTNYGVELGAEYYFNKTAKDLDLAECAFLAGINNSPNAYNPYDKNKDNTELIKKRTKVVLQKMKDTGAITNEEEYNQAVAKVDEGFKFEKMPSKGNLYSYHTDALLSQVIDQVAAEKGISKKLAENYVYSSGLKIYSTENAEIQQTMEEEFAKTQKYSITSRKTKDEEGNKATSEAAMVVIDHKTGYVLGTVGGLGDKSESRGLNRATQSKRQTGSSMKPIADVVPGLEEGIITAATEYADAETEFAGNYKPKNYNYFRGVITVRDAIETSQNIPFVKIMAELTPEKSIDYLKKMGITSIDDVKDKGLSLSIGGLTNGVSPLEMAAAYATIANDGVYIQPTFYSKVTDVNGETVLEPKQKTERVMSEANAYIAKDLLTAPVVGSSGTARYCALPGIETAAKTGTTNDDYDRWLCGFSPYYTAATWYGFDVNEEIIYSGTNPAGQLWSNVMKPIHQNLANAEFIRPSNIVEEAVYSPTKGTKYTEVFVSGTVPSESERKHGEAYEICTESGLRATEYCPETETRYYGSGGIPKEQLNLWKTVGYTNSGKGTAPTGICNIHTKASAKETEKESKQSETQNSEQKSSKPKISLSGGATITLNVGDTYSEPGYSASDDKDGDITSKVQVKIPGGSVDTSTAGTIYITYTVKNSSGKSDTVKRTVKVVGKAKPDPTPEPDPTPTPTPDPTPDPDPGEETTP